MTVPPSDSSRDPARDDELFQQIVAGYGQESSDPVPRWPVSEDVGDTAAEAPPAPEPGPAYPPLSGVPEDEALPAWVEPPALEDDGHYEPPPPPRLPRPRLRTVMASLILLFGLAVLFVPFRVGLDDSTLSLLLGMLLTGGGAAMLIMGMRDAPGSDDGPDGGAVV
jgi:hypothetical protein